MQIEGLNHYQELALRTARSTLSDEIRQCNWAMGLAGEAGELSEVFIADEFSREALTKELGDVYWYGAVMANEYEIRFSDLRMFRGQFKSGYPLARLTVAACKLCDYIKKAICHGHGVERSEVFAMLSETMGYAELLAKQHRIELADVMNANIEKLMKRYPEGFDTERSMNREE